MQANVMIFDKLLPSILGQIVLVYSLFLAYPVISFICNLYSWYCADGETDTDYHLDMLDDLEGEWHLYICVVLEIKTNKILGAYSYNQICLVCLPAELQNIKNQLRSDSRTAGRYFGC